MITSLPSQCRDAKGDGRIDGYSHMNAPTVTIGLPVYNGENYLAEAIDSILRQTYEDFELVISDNGSTDATNAICQKYSDADERVTFHRIDVNQGATWNFNRVVELARGEYFRWAAHDDLLAPGCLQHLVGVLDTRPEVVLAHSDVEIIDAAGVSQGVFRGDDSLQFDAPRASDRFAQLLQDHRCFEVFGLIRTDVLRAAGEMGAYGHADGILLTRLAMHGPFEKVDQPLFSERMHPNQSMSMYNCYTEEEGGSGGPADFHSYAAWYDPRAAGKLVFPYWRMLREHLVTVLTARTISLSERARSLGSVGSWIRHKRYFLRLDVKIAIQHARDARKK